MFEELSPPYATIVADPPWHYAKVNPDAPAWSDNAGHWSSGAFARGAGLPYSSMTVEEIKRLPVGDLGADARCFLWTTNRYLRDGWSVLEAWGFEAQTRTLVWCKPPRATTPITTEFILIDKRKKPTAMP